MLYSNKSILEKGNAAIISGDNEGFLVHCTDDTEWTFVGEQILRGKNEVRKWMKETYKEPPNFRVENLIAEGDFVTAIGNITMKDKDGVESEYAYCDIWKFSDGKIVELKAFVIKNAIDAPE